MSWNTFGGTLWTDGFMDADMAPEQKEYVKCPHCRTCLWIEDQKVIEPDSNNYENGYLNPDFDDYISATEDVTLTVDRVKYLRIRAWWKNNNKRREYWNIDRLSDIEINNIQELYKLLSFDIESDTVMMVEIKRELEEYEEALDLIEYSLGGKYQDIATFILSLIYKRDYTVHKVESIDIERFHELRKLLNTDTYTPKIKKNSNIYKDIKLNKIQKEKTPKEVAEYYLEKAKSQMKLYEDIVTNDKDYDNNDGYQKAKADLKIAYNHIFRVHHMQKKRTLKSIPYSSEYIEKWLTIYKRVRV